MGKETQSEILEEEFTAREFIEEFYKIKNKNSELVSLKFNHAQEKLYELLKENYGTKPLRFIILKARQLGISTFFEAIITYLTTFNANTNSVIIAHQADSATSIFNMTKLYIDELPEGMKPQQKYSNAKEIVFDGDNGLKSSVRVMVASDATRGSTYKLAHLSEVAFWEHPKEALTALNQAVPMTDDSLIVLESTANGFNHFYNLWQDAVNGRNDYIPVFFPWYVDPNYKRPYTGFELTQYEKDIQEKYNLSLDQLQWRRWCIANNCNNDELTFRQEYPITPEEAFVTSGTSVFNTEKILQHVRELREPLLTGGFRYEYDGLAIRNIQWYNEPLGPIKIYKLPEEGSYAIGGDTAGEGSDFFAGQVLDRDGFLCATLHFQYDPDLYAKQMFCLGKYYNYAVLAIEMNFDLFPNMELQRLKYPNIYLRQKYDQVTTDYQDKFGFRTTSLTRPKIISQLVEIARDDIGRINDRETLQEMLSFEKVNGKPQAAEGAHDDLVMSLAIAYEALSQVPKKFSFSHDKPKSRKKDSSLDKFIRLGRNKI